MLSGFFTPPWLGQPTCLSQATCCMALWLHVRKMDLDGGSKQWSPESFWVSVTGHKSGSVDLMKAGILLVGLRSLSGLLIIN